ncbi:MAG TPA: YbhB/YbcL family Raf kinase inhibitor-like protein [Kofleriaceae bacterium]|nr:YbhB/YbcL family Raf kinase inhibitor-like protein [Kofleriaceae bacterium]
MLAAAPAVALADKPITMSSPVPPSPSRLELQVTSNAFTANQPIPPEFTCDGTDAAPPLAWSQVPKETRSVAVFVDDADAPRGTFTHWLITGISPLTQSLGSGGALPQGAVAAKNSKGEAGYTGPCPAAGKHRYYFHVFALDTALATPVDKVDFLRAIDGHVLADGVVMGTYQRTTTP